MSYPALVNLVIGLTWVVFFALTFYVSGSWFFSRLRDPNLRSWRLKDWLKAIGIALFFVLMVYAFIFWWAPSCSANPNTCAGP